MSSQSEDWPFSFAIKVLLPLCLVILICFNSCNNYNQLKIDSSVPNKPVFSYTIEESLVFDGEEKLSAEKCGNILSLHLINDNGVNDVEVLGDYSYKNPILSFEPRFPLSNNLKFEIRYGIEGKRGREYFTVASNITNSDNVPQVKQVFPINNEIPCNILTFYIEFDQQMHPYQMAYQNVKLLDKNEVTLSKVWREKSYWINNNKTLVMMIHPGRVKHGIRSTSALEDLLIPGNTYVLRIEEGFKSLVNGTSKMVVEKNFEIRGNDKTLPFFKDNDLITPNASSEDNLIFSFSEPMDYGLIRKWLKIRKGEETISGSLTTKNDIQWSFNPDYKWEVGDYQIILKNKIADLAHNQLDRLFETNNEKSFTENYDITYGFTISE